MWLAREGDERASREEKEGLEGMRRGEPCGWANGVRERGVGPGDAGPRGRGGRVGRGRKEGEPSQGKGRKGKEKRRKEIGNRMGLLEFGPNRVLRF